MMFRDINELRVERERYMLSFHENQLIALKEIMKTINNNEYLKRVGK
ncbi:MAG: hypothetical protein KA886_10280 [Candidatus Cloacimonetes bacterium]|nr:hypothetical protein [Candidatus Cloacimonadota bacterium]